MIKVVVFDLWGTIIGPASDTFSQEEESEEEALSAILREAGHEVYFQEVWATRHLVSFIDYPRGRANTPHEYYVKVLERLEIQPDSALVDRLVQKDAELDKPLLYPDVKPTVDALRARGIKTAIVTTIAAWRFVPFLKQNNVEIDFVCTGREAKAAKPNPKIYTTALKRLEAKANEAMMVGDDIKVDMEPAKKLGMRTAFLCRKEKIECRDADHVIASLTELLDLL